MSRILRILDANANRSREAMRVMEEAARFVLDAAALSRKCKKLRHDLAAAIGALPRHITVELHRDTPGDVGTRITTASEQHRADLPEVVVAAGKRLSESLRALEEYGKLIDPAFASRIEKLRYRGYMIEATLHKHLPPTFRGRGWRVCVLITESLCTHYGWLDVAQAALDGGADCLQLREKHLESGELLKRAKKLVKLAGDRADVIINDRLDIAMACGAAGVHLGQHDLPLREARRIAGRSLLIGASTHNLTEAKLALSGGGGADYCGIGAMFPTTTKNRRPSGVKYLRAFVKHYPAMPHLCIGGITPDNIGQLVKAGCRGIAVSSVVCSAKRPATTVRQLRRALGV